MGSLGFGEILIILVIGFLLLGPAKFQKFIKKIGEAMGLYSKIQNEVKDSIYDVKDSITKKLSIDELTKDINLNDKTANEEIKENEDDK